MSANASPRAAATEVRRRRILDAALRCFSRSGPADTKMGDICAEASVSIGSVYHHFAGKDQLAAALYLEGLRDYQRGLLSELERHVTAERGIRAIVAHHIDWVVRHPEWARFLSQHRQAEFLRESQAEIDAVNEAFHGQVGAWLLPFVERGEVMRLPRELFTPVVMGPTFEYMTRWLASGGEGDPRRATQVLATTAWNGVRVRRAEIASSPARSSQPDDPAGSQGVRPRPDHPLASVEEAIEALAAGRMVIVVDAADREDEGDFICAAEKVTPEIVHFMTRQGGGLFCMPVAPSLAEEKGFSMMVENNTTPTGTPFTVPVDHRTCHTGISAAERARTVHAVLDPTSTPEDFRTPGHLFVLVAKEGGVLRRAGHTEATVDLARLAGLAPAGVLCEICSREGHGMAGAEELQAIAAEFQMPIVSIEDVIRYRREREQLVHRVPGADAELPTRYGSGRVLGYRVDHEHQEPVAFVFGDLETVEAPLVRMHSSCLTGDLLNSLRCDCGDQLALALERIGAEGAGVLVYLPQEGRGIGLIEKLRAYQLQDQGLDTVEANEALGYRADPRDYMVGLQILRDLGLRRIRLLTNNPKKVDAFVYSSIGIEVVDQVPLLAPPEPARERYLATKRDKMGIVCPREALMIFRQLFDPVSCTYTYLIGSRRGGEALILDPVLDRVDRYLQLIRELELELVKAVDTHVHADHVSGLGALRDRTHCATVMGAESGVDVVSIRVSEGDRVEIEGGIGLDALYTPGHTSESYSFLMGDRVFTGDTLLIRGTGRTDFQNGDPRAQYQSLFGKLLKLPEETLVYPAHDYKGDMVSTIGEEKRFNPRLQVGSVDEYVEIMNNLKLDNPKMMDVAVPANLRLGLAQDALDAKGWSVTAEDLMRSIERGDAPILIDLREGGERARRGVIPGSVHAPYGDTDENVRPGGLLHELARNSRRPLVFYCAFGERSAMALEMARRAGIERATHLKGGIAAWRDAGGTVES